MAEIQTRLAYVCCVQQLEQVKDSEYCEYIRPPIDHYGTLEFGKFDEIAVSFRSVPQCNNTHASSTWGSESPSDPQPPCVQEVGYQHGKTLFDVWQRSGVVDSMLKDRHQEEFHKTKTGHVSANCRNY